jgi:hypothetical protein
LSATNPVVNAIVAGSKARGLDPNAVLAVASVEGLSGRIGDGGHAYGPFQLNNAGGVITNRYPGAYRQDVQSWASSPQGIGYALDRIANVARGRSGRDAVVNIVQRFERPADPRGEIGRALARLGSGGGAVPSPTAGAAPGQAPPVARSPLADPLVAQIVASNNALIGIPTPSALLAPGVTIAPPAAPPRTQAKVAQPRVTGRTVKALEQFAQPYGLTVTATTGGKHAKNSYHYRGRAVDFGGDPRSMAALAEAALQHAHDFTEFIYTGPGSPGFSVLNGRVIPNAQLPGSLYSEHTNHVHLAR